MIAFLDLETTGLDPAKCAILQIACVLVTDKLERIPAEPFSALVDLPPNMSGWETGALRMHLRSGLLSDIKRANEHSGTTSSRRTRDARRSSQAAEFELIKWLETWTPVDLKGQPIHLAGNSVHFDRSFLRVHMPRVESLFHHRHLDVSSLRIVGQAFGGKWDARPAHRALEDVEQSIQEMHYWIDFLREHKTGKAGLNHG